MATVKKTLNLDDAQDRWLADRAHEHGVSASAVARAVLWWAMGTRGLDVATLLRLAGTPPRRGGNR